VDELLASSFLVQPVSEWPSQCQHRELNKPKFQKTNSSAGGSTFRKREKWQAWFYRQDSQSIRCTCKHPRRVCLKEAQNTVKIRLTPLLLPLNGLTQATVSRASWKQFHDTLTCCYIIHGRPKRTDRTTVVRYGIFCTLHSNAQ